MTIIKKFRWTDCILPLVIIAIALFYGVYIISNPTDRMVSNYLTVRLITSSLERHFYLIIVSSLLAVCTSLPLGIILTRPAFKVLKPFFVGLVNICQTIPSLAVLALFVGILGIGTNTAIFALWIYSLLPILNNTIAGITGVDPAVIDSARGMGMTKLKVLVNVELPLAMPVIMAGIRTAVVINVATAVVAAYVGAGGLGDIIIAGKNINRWQAWSLGAVYSAGIALLLDHILGVVERVLTE